MPNMGIITNTVVTDLGIWEGLLQILCFEFMILVEFRDLAYLTIFRVPKKAWASQVAAALYTVKMVLLVKNYHFSALCTLSIHLF